MAKRKVHVTEAVLDVLWDRGPVDCPSSRFPTPSVRRPRRLTLAYTLAGTLAA
jgi:hypothetical protein